MTLSAGAIFGMLAVILGATGAHTLKDTLASLGRTETFELAVRYQFYHAFALLVTGLLMPQISSAKMKYAAMLFTGGIFLFSGSLYVLCITGITLLGAVTPLGGVAFIAGWILMLLAIAGKK